MVDRVPGTYPIRTINNVTPFTYRDGYSFLEILEYLRRKLREIAATLNAFMDWTEQEIRSLYDYIDSEIAIVNERITREVATLNKRIDREVLTLNERIDREVTALNDRIDREVNTLNERITTEIARVDKRIDELTSNVNQLTQRVQNLEQWQATTNVTINSLLESQSDLNVLIGNLRTSGAWDDSLNGGAGGLRAGRNIATGNINVFGGTPDGTSFVRTNSGQSTNDIAAGI